MNPVLFNFFMLTGGVIGEKKDDTPFQQNRTLFGSYGYIDFAYVMTGMLIWVLKVVDEFEFYCRLWKDR